MTARGTMFFYVLCVTFLLNDISMMVLLPHIVQTALTVDNLIWLAYKTLAYNVMRQIFWSAIITY